MLGQRLEQKEVTTEGVLQMIRRQVKLWKDDPKMREFLRPTTLFNSTKFNEYYAAREQPIPSQNLRSGKPNDRNFGMPSTTQQASARILSELSERGEGAS
jgi:hypothetical protein